MSAVQMNLGYESQSIELSCAFIDHYMAKCNPFYALIYIFCLRRCLAGADISSQDINELFKTDLSSAMRFWEKEGLVSLEEKNGTLSLTFLPVRLPEHTVPEAKPAGENRKTAALASRPQYTLEELTEYRRQSKDVERLFTAAEQALGKLLTFNDMNIIFGFYDWLRLPIDVIQYLFNYCTGNSRRDLRYIEKAAADWADKGLFDLEKALAYVQTFDRDYSPILKVMGQTAGYPSPSQKRYMDKWLYAFHMPAEMVLEACDRSALHIGKSTFAYVDKIIESWNSKGIKTLEAAAAETDTFTEEKKAARKKPDVKQPKTNRFVNFKQRENDYNQLEKMEREYVLQRLKG